MKGSSHNNNLGAAVAPGGSAATATRPPLLTVADLAARWGISPYTIREWARAGRITDCRYDHGEWRFLESARLRLPARGGAVGVADKEALLDFATVPLTVTDVATHDRCNEDTVRRRARAGRYAAAVHTPVGWRFGLSALDPSTPASAASSGPPGPSSTAQEGGTDPLAELRAMTFDARTLGIPALSEALQLTPRANDAPKARRRPAISAGLRQPGSRGGHLRLVR
ncbi:helix-turn-helix domain-containing protein [Gemmatimonas sp.]|uniref:helix-turn-helix domain-containing protein n=1 Tax=Gemmatimonas sp. TaxID=1962908 RepID=UPI00333F6165